MQYKILEGFLRTASIFFVLLAVSCCSPRKTKTEQEPPAVSLKTLISAPQKYLDSTILVTGFLYNAGSNYFSDLRVFLKDNQDSIAVNVWLPIETPPPGPYEMTQRPVLSNYLAKEVRLVAHVCKEVKYYLKVESAEVITK